MTCASDGRSTPVRAAAVSGLQLSSAISPAYSSLTCLMLVSVSWPANSPSCSASLTQGLSLGASSAVMLGALIAFESYIKLTIKTDKYDRSVAGTVFGDGQPRIIQVRDINMEFPVTSHMLFVRNSDRPGFIGRLGSIAAEAGLNIATLNLGRDKPGGDAICVAAFDEPVPDAMLAKVKALPQVVRVNRLEF